MYYCNCVRRRVYHVKNGTTASTDNPPADGIVTYDVDLEGGKYIIWGRVTIASTTADSFWVKVDGAESNQPLHKADGVGGILYRLELTGIGMIFIAPG